MRRPGSAHAGVVSPLLWAFIVVSAMELVAAHLILPWPTVRLVLDIASAWGLVWILGMVAAFKVHPHLVGPSGLRVRYGVTLDFTVPWDAMTTIAVRERTRDRSRTIQIDPSKGGHRLNVVMASRTNVDVALSRPLVVRLPRGEESVTALRLYADDSRGLVRRAPTRTVRVPGDR